MIFDLIVPRNEGSGGSNEILVGDGSKVWDWSFKIALHGSVMFYELQIAYKLLTLFCWLILILGEEGWAWANKVGAMWNFAGNLYFSQNTIEGTQYWLTYSSDWVLPDCVWTQSAQKGQKGCKIDVGTMYPRGMGGGSIRHRSRRRHKNAQVVIFLRV